MIKQFSYFITALLGLCCFQASALKIGVTAGPHADIVNRVKELADKESLKIEVIEFNDFVMPNEALAGKELDVNSMQHEPYLQAQIASRGYMLKSVAKTVVMPLGLYSTKIKTVNDLSTGATVAIPNDPSNGGRALKLLAKAGIIELKGKPDPSILDIAANTKKLTFIEIEAPLLPQTLQDVEAALINTDWALIAGLDPGSAIYQEGKESDYANVLVVREGDEKREDIQKFVKLYQSEEIKDFIKKRFKGAVVPAW